MPIIVTEASSGATIRFTDPDDDAVVRLDLSARLDGEPDFGRPEGDRRTIVLPLILEGTSQDDLLANFRNLVKEVERSSALEVKLQGATNSVWFDALLTERARRRGAEEDRSYAQELYTWPHGRNNIMRCNLVLVSKPYARGVEITAVNAASIANGPDGSCFVDVASGDAFGDVEAPARVEITLPSAINRGILQVFRRTTGDPTKWIAILEPEADLTGTDYDVSREGTVTIVNSAGMSNGGGIEVPTPATTLTEYVAFTLKTNLNDKVDGAVQVFAKLRDKDTTPGRYRAQATYRETQGPALINGKIVVPTADTDHDNNSHFELWDLGVFDLAKPAAYDTNNGLRFGLQLQRTGGSTSGVQVDYLALCPADESMALIDFKAVRDNSAATVKAYSLDSEKRKAWWGTLSSYRGAATFSGPGVLIKPGTRNRFFVQLQADAGHGSGLLDDPPAIDLQTGATITIKYRPRWRFVR